MSVLGVLGRNDLVVAHALHKETNCNEQCHQQEANRHRGLWNNQGDIGGFAAQPIIRNSIASSAQDSDTDKKYRPMMLAKLMLTLAMSIAPAAILSAVKSTSAARRKPRLIRSRGIVNLFRVKPLRPQPFFLLMMRRRKDRLVDRAQFLAAAARTNCSIS
jgi:hypothetical protein